MSKEIQCKCCKDYWWETNIHSKSGLCHNCYDYVADLEAELAEKEKKKIESCNHTIYMNMLNQEMLQLKVANLEQSQNQKAIAELEKVKKFLLEKIAEKQSCFDSGNYNDFADGVKTICELILISIDNQIKSLKGENK